MPSIFLSHTRTDKPFVEKLARDLIRLGFNVWFDKWNIKIGESITWKINEGIRENEYLGIVLSPESLNSEWVKSELGTAWIKQMKARKVFVLPILYRDCSIPLFMADRKYADFRNDYDEGLSELVSVFGINDIETISYENWRKFSRKKNTNWQYFRKREFERLVTSLVTRAKVYNWSAWVGGTKTPFSITLSAILDNKRKKALSIKISGKSFSYMACEKFVSNPNNLKATDFDRYIGNTINECEEYVWRQMEDFKACYGNPTDAPFYYTTRFLNKEELTTATKSILKELDWFKEDE
jgi:hypothetical protein